MEPTMTIGNIGIGNTSTLTTIYKMGAEIIPGLLESIRKATSERREYGKGKKAAFEAGARVKNMV